METRRYTLALGMLVWASVGGCGISANSSAKRADAATATVTDAGSSKLTCTEREQMAAEAVSRAMSSATLRCTSTAECELIEIDTACHAACGALVSKTGKPSVQAAIAAQDSSVCKTYAADGCKRIFPPCTPPVPYACVAGQCTAVDHGQDGGS